MENRDMEAAVRAFFERYALFVNRALTGTLDVNEFATVYAPEFIAASPQGVQTGKNDASLKAVMEQGYAQYRALGTKEMRLQDIRVTLLDPLHCVASVHWRAVYARQSAPEVEIEFDVHYLMQHLNGGPQIFGWVTGDEDAELRKHGIIR